MNFKEVISIPTISVSIAAITAIANIYNIYSTKREKKRLLKMEQATKISGWIDSLVDEGKYKVCFNNNSNKPIYEVIVIGVYFYGEKTSSLENIDENRFRVFSQLPPGKSFSTITLASGMNKSFGIEISFTDSNGLCWNINQKGRLSKIKKNYLDDVYKLFRPISFDTLKKE